MRTTNTWDSPRAIFSHSALLKCINSHDFIALIIGFHHSYRTSDTIPLNSMFESSPLALHPIHSSMRGSHHARAIPTGAFARDIVILHRRQGLSLRPLRRHTVLPSHSKFQAIRPHGSTRSLIFPSSHTSSVPHSRPLHTSSRNEMSIDQELGIAS